MSNSAYSTRIDIRAGLKRSILIGLGIAILAGVISLASPDIYHSEARYLPLESKGLSTNLGGLASAAAAFGVTVPGSDGNDLNILDILNSRWLRERLLATQQRYHIRSWRFGSEKIVSGNLYDYLKAKNADRGMNALGNVLFVSRDLKTKVVIIAAETRSPDLSRAIVQQTGNLLEEFFSIKGRTRGGAKAAFATARLAEARNEMDTAENQFRLYLESNRNYQSSTDPAVRLHGNRLEAELRLRQQLVSAIAMNREQALLEEKNDIPILNILDEGNLPIEKARPSRSKIVFLWLVFGTIGAWTFHNRIPILAKLKEG